MTSRRKVLKKGADVATSSSDDDESDAGGVGLDDDCSTDDGEVIFKVPVAARRKSSRGKAGTTAPERAAPSPKCRPVQQRKAAIPDNEKETELAPALALPSAPAPAKVEASLSNMQKAQDGQDVACHALLWMLNDCTAADPTAARAADVRESLLPVLQRLEKTAGLLRRVCGSAADAIASSSDGGASSAAAGGGAKKKKKGNPLEQAAGALEQRLAKLLPAEAAAPDESAAASAAAASAAATAPLAPAASKLNSLRGCDGSVGGGKSSRSNKGGGGAGGKAAPALGGLVDALQEAKGKLRKTSGRSKKRATPAGDDGSMKNELLKSLALRRAAIKANCDDEDSQSPCQSPGAFGTPSKKARLS